MSEEQEGGFGRKPGTERTSHQADEPAPQRQVKSGASRQVRRFQRGIQASPPHHDPEDSEVGFAHDQELKQRDWLGDPWVIAAHQGGPIPAQVQAKAKTTPSLEVCPGRQLEARSPNFAAVQLRTDGLQTPVFEPFNGAAVNQVGRISAPADQYAHAKSSGVNVRAKPDGTLPSISTIRYGQPANVLALDVTGGFYFIVGNRGGVTGWIGRSFVALDAPDATARLHHITEPDLTTLLERQYVAEGLWQLSTGNDYTTLAAAVAAANYGRKGIWIDWDAHRAYKETHPVKRTIDPWMIDNFAVYHASQIYAGHNIWLPSPEYIKLLQGAGVIGSRPELVNAAIEVGQELTGFSAGVSAGALGSVWDTLVGLWQLGGAIIDTITGLLDGSLFQSLQDIYEQLSQLTWTDAARMAEEIITLGKAAIGDFMSQWQHPDTYQRWFFRGQIVGAIALEVVLAVFSVGATLGVKVLAKIGKYAPRLASVLRKLLVASDKLDFGNKRHSGHRQLDRDHDRNRDHNDHKDDDNDHQRDWQQTLALARLVTEEHDLRDTPVEQLLVHLNGTLAAKSKAVRGYRAEPHRTKPGHHRVVQFSREADVDKDYSGARPDRSVASISIDQVTVSVAKFHDYIFKPGADHGKTYVFESLGYRREHSAQLAQIFQEQAYRRYRAGQFDKGRLDKYGQRIDIEITLEGIGDSAGKVSRLRSGWMLEKDGIRLNTPFSGFMD